jgi:hypothetical protein
MTIPPSMSLRGKIALALATLLSLTLCGCWVYSVHSLVDDEEQLVFDKALLGSWWQPEAGCTVTLSRFYEERYYRLVYAAPPKKMGGGCLLDSGRSAAFEARLIELSGTRFLDLYPVDREKLHHDLSLHSFYKVKVLGDALTLIPMDFGWTKSQWQQSKLGIAAREGDDSLVLTGDTDALQKLVSDHSDDDEAFSTKKQLVFHRRTD